MSLRSVARIKAVRAGRVPAPSSLRTHHNIHPVGGRISVACHDAEPLNGFGQALLFEFKQTQMRENKIEP
jgi:hypothetical protein